MAVLQSGYAARYDGTTWSRPAALPSADGGEPDSVSCPTARFCLAVDARDSATLVYKNSRWSSGGTIPDRQTGMASVSCPASDFCAAVDGQGGNVVTFDGTTWTTPVTVDTKAAHSLNGPVLIFLMSVSCPSATFCVAGDTTGDAFVRS